MPSDLRLISSDPSILVILSEFRSSEKRYKDSKVGRAVDPRRKYRRVRDRHCVFASLYRIKNIAMTDIPPGGTKLRNALKRINKHASNFANLLAQPFRRSTA